MFALSEPGAARHLFCFGFLQHPEGKLAAQDSYSNSFKPRWRPVTDWPNKEDRALGRAGWVAERKYEIDSGAYYLSFLWNYWCTASAVSFMTWYLGWLGFTPCSRPSSVSVSQLAYISSYVRVQQLYGADRFMKEPILFDAAYRVVDTWRIELQHEEQSGYRFAELQRGGLGGPVNFTGKLILEAP